MNKFYTQDDIDLIKSELINNNKDITKTWKSDNLKELKSRIKQFHLTKQDEQCCYCKKEFHGEFSFDIDIEHILPKGHKSFKRFMFHIWNLSVACKRCNMSIKREKITFISTLDEALKQPQSSQTYKFIHPNFDEYFQHIELVSEKVNNFKFIKYNIINNSDKGIFTYDFFELMKLEIDTLDKIQGLTPIEPIADSIADDQMTEIEMMLSL